MKPILHVICLLAITLTACNKKDVKQDTPPEADNWTISNNQPRPLGEANWSFTIGSKVYFGSDKHDLLIYDLSTKKWLGSFNYPKDFALRWLCGVAVHNNKAYIGGGRTNEAIGGFRDDWWEFTPDAPSPWRKLPDCPMGGTDGTAFVYDNVLYTTLNIGNIVHSIQNRVYSMPLATEQWNNSFSTTTIFAGSSGFSLVSNDTLYFGAGYNNSVPGNLFTQQFAAFNIRNKQTSELPSFPAKLTVAENARSFIANGKIFILAQDRQLYAFSTAANKWIQKKTVETNPDHGPITYVHQSGDKVYGFTTQGYVYEYNYK